MDENDIMLLNEELLNKDVMGVVMYVETAKQVDSASIPITKLWSVL